MKRREGLMKKTVMSIQGDRFLLNGKLTYSESVDCPHQGLLMNARFIQGIFDEDVYKRQDCTRRPIIIPVS